MLFVILLYINVVARPTLRLYCLISSVMKLLFKFGNWESLVQDDSNISIFFWIRVFLSDCMAFKKFEYFIQHSMFVYIYVILNFKLRAALFMSDCFKVIRNTRCSLFANASGVYTFSWRPFENILFTTIDPHSVWVSTCNAISKFNIKSGVNIWTAWVLLLSLVLMLILIITETYREAVPGKKHGGCRLLLQ